MFKATSFRVTLACTALMAVLMSLAPVFARTANAPVRPSLAGLVATDTVSPQATSVETRPDGNGPSSSKTHDEDQATLFGPFKFVPSDGVVTHEFFCDVANVAMATLHVEQANGGSGGIDLSLNGVSVVAADDLNSTTHSLSLPIELAEANALVLESSSAGGEAVLVEVTAALHPIRNITPSRSWVPVGETTSVVVAADVHYSDEAPTVVVALSTGGGFVTLGTMTDSGAGGGDDIAGDGRFAGTVNLSAATLSPLELRITRSLAGEPAASRDFTIDVFSPFSSQARQDVSALALGCANRYYELKSQIGHEAAASQAALELQADERISSVQLEDTGSCIRFSTDAGLTSYVMLRLSPVGARSKRGDAELRESAYGASGRTASFDHPPPPMAVPNVRKNRDTYSATTVNRIGSARALVWAPFSTEDNHASRPLVDFLRSKCLPLTWQYDELATILTLDYLQRFGLVAIQTHSGPGGVLASSEHWDESQSDIRAVTYESFLQKQTATSAHIDNNHNDHAEPDEFYWAVTSAFFADSVARHGRLPSSAIFVAGCNGTVHFQFAGQPAEPSAAEAFVSGGANIAMGFAGYVHGPYANSTCEQYFRNLCDTPGATTYSAFDPDPACDPSSPTVCCGYHTPPGGIRPILPPLVECPNASTGVTSGACELSTLATVRNGGFETGDFEEWLPTGHTGFLRPQVLERYGPFEATEGRYFARLAVPEGTTNQGGSSIQQRVYAGACRGRLRKLSLDVNFIGPDFEQVCDGRLLPLLKIRLLGDSVDSSGYLQPAVLLQQECSGSIPTGLPCSDYAAGGACSSVVSSGWRTVTFDLLPRESALDDEYVYFALTATRSDAGSGYYPRLSILVDNIRIEAPVEDLPSGASAQQGSREVGGLAHASQSVHTFSSGDQILCPDFGTASTYPSEINVSSIGGGGGGDFQERGETPEVELVSVRIDGLRHSFPDDIDLILEGPTGQTVVLMSDAGGGANIEDVSLTFDDNAPSVLPDDGPIASGTYLPTNHPELFPDIFPSPAPSGPYGSSFSGFVGTNPIGIWRLWAVDSARGDKGQLLSGWELMIETTNQAPVAICQDVTVEADESCTGSATIDNGSYDPDGGTSSVLLDQSPAGPYPLGTTVVTLTVTDQEGATSQCVANVVVVDTSAPTVSCPSATTVPVTSNCLAAIPNVVSGSSATDNCSAAGSLVLSQVPAPGTMVGPGAHAVTVSATDAAGNTGTCSSIVTVIDAQAPTIAGPVPAIYLASSSSPGGAVVSFPTPSALDNCSTVTVTATPASGTVFHNGKTLVTATAVDAAGLTASTQFTVKVVRFGESIGVYIPATAGWFLRNSNTNGVADLTFQFGPGGPGWTPISGDWDRSGTDTAGLFYNPGAGVFLVDNNGPGGADYMFSYGPAGTNWIPVAGDWNGEGVDSIGLYDPSTGAFFLKNINVAGNADVILQLGPGSQGFLPIVGDWNGDGIDTVGIYNPATGAFFLRNSNTNGPADVVFTFGPGGTAFRPVSGDWNGDNICTIGLYNPSTGAFLLRNSNSNGPADLTLTFGPTEQGAIPLAGNWDAQ